MKKNLLVNGFTLMSLLIGTGVDLAIGSDEIQQGTYDIGIDQKSENNVKRSFKFTMVNDNPFLNLFPDAFYTDDDHGYTHGISLATSYLLEKGYFSPNERWSVELNTDLYTEDVTPNGQDLFPNIPQRFNEITRIKVERDDIFNKLGTNRPYYVVGAGIGLMNDEYEKGVMAVGQQTAWHDYKHHNLTPETTPLYDNQVGNTYDLFVSAKAAVGRVITFNDRMKNCGCEVDLLKLETGAEIISMRKGSNIYFLVEADKSLLNFGRNSIGLKGRSKVIAHHSGDAEVQNFVGIRYDRPKLSIESGFNHRKGDYNEDFVKYDDRDTIWNLSVEYRWGKKRR